MESGVKSGDKGGGKEEVMDRQEGLRVIRLYATFSSPRLHSKRKSPTFVGDTHIIIIRIYP